MADATGLPMPPIWPDWANEGDYQVSNRVPMAQVAAGDLVTLDTYDEPVEFEVAKGPHMTTGVTTGGLLRHALTILRPPDTKTLKGEPVPYLVPHVRRKKPEPPKATGEEVDKWLNHDLILGFLDSDVVGKWRQENWHAFKKDFDTLVAKHKEKNSNG